MIKIVRGVYGHQIGGRVVPKDKKAEPFSLTPEQEARLVGMGVAEYVGELPTEEAEEMEPVAPVYSIDMKADELRAIAKGMGLTFKVGTTKAEMVEAMDKHLDEEAEGEYDAMEEGDELPDFDPAEAVEE